MEKNLLILVIDKEINNVADRFKKAIWREKHHAAGRFYKTAAEAWKYHNRNNCNYHYENEDGNILTSFYNANRKLKQ